MVVSINIVDGKTWNALDNTPTNTICNIQSGFVGSDPLNPITCKIDVGNQRFVIRNVYEFTGSPIRIMYYARTGGFDNNFDVSIHAFANEHAYNDFNWPIFYHTTDNNYNLQTMFYSMNSNNVANTSTSNSFDAMVPS